jgi:hypothetical protein
MTIDELRCLASQKGVSPYYDENSGLQRQQRTEGRCRVQRSVKRAKPHDGAESLGQGPLLAFPSLALQCACCLCIRVSAHGTAEALGCCCVVSAVERATFDVVLGKPTLSTTLDDQSAAASHRASPAHRLLVNAAIGRDCEINRVLIFWMKIRRDTAQPATLFC